MRVLSLFDGISCARVALGKAGIPVEAYYASEVEQHSIDIALKNYPDTIQIGDVTKVDGKKYRGIDLLIGGSPCQDLSRANIKRKGLAGSRSILFYEYLRILKEAKPRYFILENVASMSSESRDIITKELGVEPIMIDAALVSAQSRRRYFWTNIPAVCQPWDRGILVKHILEDATPPDEPQTHGITKPVSIGKLEGTKGGQWCRVYDMNGKAVTIGAHPGGNKSVLYWPIGNMKIAVKEATKKGYAVAEDGDTLDISFPNSKTRRDRVGKKAKNLMTSNNIAVFTRGGVRPLTVIECERLQGVPDGYTSGVTKNKAIQSLGNAFNADVIAHILAHTK
jgi:DNA (cytosine-5)-methyltransferase 3A